MPQETKYRHRVSVLAASCWIMMLLTLKVEEEVKRVKDFLLNRAKSGLPKLLTNFDAKSLEWFALNVVKKKIIKRTKSLL